MGIWYGGWSADDLAAAQINGDLLSALGQSPGQARLNWRMEKRYLPIIQRFVAIAPNDWIVTAFDGALHLARLVGPLESSPEHGLNREGELFHFRRIGSQKSFALSDLPDSFRLIQTSGQRHVVIEIGVTERLVRLLAESASASDVRNRVSAMDFWEWMEILGPVGWESFCQGYLIIKEDLVPTGLTVGKTLPSIDIVGRSRADGVRILAQCKKTPHAEPIAVEFLEACSDWEEEVRAYYFAYEGLVGTAPAAMRVIGRREIESEAQHDEALRRYMGLFKP